MIPRLALDLSFDVPSAYRFGRPSHEDVTEEGFGGFRGTWLLHGVRVHEAREVMRRERELVKSVDEFVLSAVEFDAVALALEKGSAPLPERLLDGPMEELVEVIEQESNAGESRIGGLELGVAGLVYALSAVGCWTAASCRGHVGKNAWSDRPVVLLALDEFRGEVLRALMRPAGCGFNRDDARADLLTIEAQSIEDMMSLADAVLRAPRAFRKPRASTKTTLARHRRDAKKQEGDATAALLFPELDR